MWKQLLFNKRTLVTCKRNYINYISSAPHFRPVVWNCWCCGYSRILHRDQLEISTNSTFKVVKIEWMLFVCGLCNVLILPLEHTQNGYLRETFDFALKNFYLHTRKPDTYQPKMAICKNHKTECLDVCKFHVFENICTCTGKLYCWYRKQ